MELGSQEKPMSSVVWGPIFERHCFEEKGGKGSRTGRGGT